MPTPEANLCATTPLSVSPVRKENISTLSPVGTLVPADHVFPTPHMYFYVKNDSNPSDIESPVYSPADIAMTSIALRHYDTLGRKSDYTDYTLTFAVCDGLEMYFHHVRSLTHPSLVQFLNLNRCTPQGPGNEKFCSMPVNLSIKAGEQIGTTGDTPAGVGGLDMGARDYRLPTGRSAFSNPSRWCSPGPRHNIYDRCYTVCPLDYLPAAERDSIINLFTDYTRSIYRTEEPKCGEVYRDVTGTAQGHWLAPGKNVFGEGPHLFLGPSAFTNTLYDFSMGTSVPGLSGGQYMFYPQPSGTINRGFNDIRDEQVYCYEGFYNNYRDAVSHTPTHQLQSITILLQLINSGQNVTVEKRAEASCGTGPWTLQGAGVTFER